MDILAAYFVGNPHAAVALGPAARPRAMSGSKPVSVPVIGAARCFLTFVIKKELTRADKRGITLLLG